ncbi:MAG: hypothetical protein HRU11_14300, partial [Parvularculaceae bacterium]|nr:hypothetical protein [Parvularculaceae bacterium]
ANDSLSVTQGRISTGLKIAKADDNRSFFLVSTTQRSDIVKLQGARENLNFVLGAVQTAQTAQVFIDNAINNIRSAIISLETGTAEAELSTVIEQQIEQVREVLSGTSYAGINLLETDERYSFDGGVQRQSDGGLFFEQLQIQAQGLAIKPPAVSSAFPPVAGFVQNINSTTLFGTAGAITPFNPGNAVGINVGPGSPEPFPQKTFAISFETGANITDRQIIYEQGGNVRGLNIYVEGGQLVFGAYNLVTNDPSPAWPWSEVRVNLEANTRYTAQLVIDGNTSNSGQIRAYLDGQLVDSVGGVGVLYEHPGGIGVGQINGNAVLNGTVANANPITNFQGRIDKVVQYNEVFSGDLFDQVTTYLAEDWLPAGSIQYFVGSDARKESATLIELLEAVTPVDQDGFSTAGALEVLDAAQEKSNRAFSRIGFVEQRIIRQQNYLGDLTASMQEGVAALVEADLAEESARLQATQVQVQLAQQSLFIANQRPRSLLSLFQ